MRFIPLFRLLSVLATCKAAPHLHLMPRSTSSPGTVGPLVGVGLDLWPALIRLERQVDGSEWQEGGEQEDVPSEINGTSPDDGQWHGDTSASATREQPAVLAAPSDPPSSSLKSGSSMSSTVGWSETSVSAAGPISTDPSASSSAAAMAMSALSSTSMTVSYSYTSFTPSMTSSATMSAASAASPSASSVSSPASSVSGNATVKVASEEEEAPKDNEKTKKIRYKQCPSTGTVSEIKVTPCEGGKGTILDPCHFHAGSNYTIELSFVTPLDSQHPRSNLIARDKSMSNGPGSEDFPYSGQSFDACAYTTCPIAANTSSQYTYEFVTLNDRFDQLTFNITDGFEGPSMFCSYFPVTFVPNVVSRSLRLPFAGLGPRGPW